MSVPLSLRVAAVLLWITGIGGGIPCLMAIRNLLAGRALPIVLGFTAYGGGPFERYGLQTTVPLLAGFLLVLVLESVAGVLLWGGHMSGAILALVLLLPGAVYWWGFELPFPPIFAVVRTILIVLGWQSLR